jgi:hypothetical protein
MGKHERDWVEEAEKAVTNGLNGQPQNIWIDQVVNSIKLKVQPSYTQAVWAGGADYGTPGDVHIRYEHVPMVKIELKFSRQQGTGTAKNISTRALCKQVSADIKNYPDFDSALGLKHQRYQLIESVTGTTLKTATKYASVLRDLKTANHPVIDQIATITAPGQIQYAQYAAGELNKHLPKVNTLVNSLLNTDLVDQLHQDVVYCVIRNFETADQTVDFFDFTDMDRNVTKVEATGKSIKFVNAGGKDVVRFSVTWKNICQGGSTPCFNVFVGNAFKGK